MNEASGQGPASVFDPVAIDGVSAGMLLRHARESAGLHVASLAVALKVPVRKLEALEADRYEELLDAVFARALAASVCRTLKIDPEPVLQRLPTSGAPRLAMSDGRINAPFRSPSDSAGPGWREQMSRPVYLVVFGLLLGALVLILLPAQREELASTPADAAPAPAQGPFQSPPSEQAVADAAMPAPNLVAATTVTVASPAATRSAAAPPAVDMAPAVSGPSPSLAVTPQLGAAAAPAGGTVVFKAKGESWVQVTDAKGVVVLRRLLTAGESAGASGEAPLTVTVGSVSTTEVAVRGKPFDLAPLARDNVARFEVK